MEGKRITITYMKDTPIPEFLTPGVVKAMKDEGKSLRKIGKTFGVSHETIRKLLKKAG